MNDCIYEKDFYEWTQQQAQFIKNGEFQKLDIINLEDEIESMGRSEKRALRSQITRLLMHMLKKKYQPENDNSNSWDSSINDAKREIKYIIEDSPSLKSKLKNIFNDAYELAKIRASRETKIDEKVFPDFCPWNITEILNLDD